MRSCGLRFEIEMCLRLIRILANVCGDCRSHLMCSLLVLATLIQTRCGLILLPHSFAHRLGKERGSLIASSLLLCRWEFCYAYGNWLCVCRLECAKGVTRIILDWGEELLGLVKTTLISHLDLFAHLKGLFLMLKNSFCTRISFLHALRPRRCECIIYNVQLERCVYRCEQYFLCSGWK